MEEKEQIKPLLIDFDSISFERDLHLLRFLINQHGNQIEKAVSRLDIGLMTDEDLQDILSNSLDRIKAKLMDHVRGEIKSKYLLPPAIDKASAIFSRLEEVAEEVNKTIYHYSVSYRELLTVSEKGMIVLTEDSAEELRDAHRTYLYTEAGQSRYRAHVKAAKAIQTFVNSMGGTVSALDVVKDYFDVDGEDKVFPVTLNCYE